MAPLMNPASLAKDTEMQSACAGILVNAAQQVLADEDINGFVAPIAAAVVFPNASNPVGRNKRAEFAQKVIQAPSVYAEAAARLILESKQDIIANVKNNYDYLSQNTPTGYNALFSEAEPGNNLSSLGTAANQIFSVLAGVKPEDVN